MKTLFINCAAFLICSSLLGQGFREDITRLNEHFINSQDIRLDITYLLRADHRPDSKVMSQSKGRYCKLKSSVLNQYNEKITVNTPTELIVVDHENHRIRIKKKPATATDMPDFLSQLHAYFGLIDTVTNSVTKDDITYEVFLKSGAPQPILKYEVVLASKDKSIKRLSFYYSKPLRGLEQNGFTGNEIPRLDIVFRSADLSTGMLQKELNPGHYYKSNESIMTPADAFAGYDIKEMY